MRWMWKRITVQLILALWQQVNHENRSRDAKQTLVPKITQLHRQEAHFHFYFYHWQVCKCDFYLDYLTHPSHLPLTTYHVAYLPVWAGTEALFGFAPVISHLTVVPDGAPLRGRGENKRTTRSNERDIGFASIINVTWKAICDQIFISGCLFSETELR